MDLDLELRLTAFEHLRRLSAQHAGALPSAVLNLGFTFRGERVPLWNYQRGIYKPAALGPQGAALSVQTSFDSPYDDRHDRDDDRFVYRYQGRDPQHRDNIALRRAMDTGRPIVYFVAVDRGLYDAVFPTYVVGDSPDHLAFFLLADSANLVRPETFVADADFPRKAYVTREVKHRLHQQRFRSLVLTAYGTRCAMCRFRHKSLLDAAHIIPDRDDHGMPEVPNGLALCRIHHGAYDVGIVGVTPDYLIHVRRDVLEEHDGPMLRHGLQELHQQRIVLPRRADQKPNQEFLAERYRSFLAA